jgi:hypothetical protein
VGHKSDNDLIMIIHSGEKYSSQFMLVLEALVALVPGDFEVLFDD